MRKRLPVYLTVEEIRRLRRAMNSAPVKHKAMVALMLYAGLRVSEVAKLKWANVDLDEMTLWINGKGDKERLVPINDKLSEVLQEYRKAVSGNGYLFPHRLDIWRHMTIQGMGKVVRKYASSAEIQKKISPHKLRHTFATQLLNKDADLRSIQKLLGHESLETTAIYAHVDLRRERTMVNRLDF